jgi:hypothetical protein
MTSPSCALCIVAGWLPAAPAAALELEPPRTIPIRFEKADDDNDWLWSRRQVVQLQDGIRRIVILVGADDMPLYTFDGDGTLLGKVAMERPTPMDFRITPAGDYIGFGWADLHPFPSPPRSPSPALLRFSAKGEHVAEWILDRTMEVQGIERTRETRGVDLLMKLDPGLPEAFGGWGGYFIAPTADEKTLALHWYGRPPCRPALGTLTFTLAGKPLKVENGIRTPGGELFQLHDVEPILYRVDEKTGKREKAIDWWDNDEEVWLYDFYKGKLLVQLADPAADPTTMRGPVFLIVDGKPRRLTKEKEDLPWPIRCAGTHLYHFNPKKRAITTWKIKD